VTEKGKESAGSKAVENSLKAYYKEVKKVSSVEFWQQLLQVLCMFAFSEVIVVGVCYL